MFIILTGIFEEITLMGYIHACKSELFITQYGKKKLIWPFHLY